jgi:hypothetical protein
VPTPQVQADDIGNGIVAGVDRERRLNTGRSAGTISVAPIEDPVLVDDNWLVQSMLTDIGHEFGEVLALD